MPTFEAAIEPQLPVLGAASALAGLAFGIVVYVLAGRVREEIGRTTPSLSDAQRRVRRQRAQRESGLYGLMMSVLPPFVLLARVLPLGNTSDSLAERYGRAGWPGGLDDDEITGVALLAGVIVAILVTLLVLLVYPLAAPLGVVGVLTGPGVVSGWLTRRAAERDLEISRTMPFVLDLLVLTMRAGAPLNVAMERVVTDYSGHPIGAEFGAVLADMEMGVTKSDALENLAERNPIPAVRTFADDLNQAEELGRPVADALERLSDRSRQRRVQEATEMAGKAKVMVLVPGMLVFVAVLILLFAPFAVRYFYGGYTGF
ncbi:MAG: type II secretion system F family protein [Planctomycetota bacterium]|jgi:tight adherence protein C